MARLLLAGCLVVCATVVVADDASPADAAKKSDAAATIVASFGDQQVTLAEVERGVKLALRGAQVSPETLAQVQAQILEQLIERRLTLRYLEEQKLAATSKDLDDAVEDIKRQLRLKGQTYEQFLVEKLSTEADVREELAYKKGTHNLLQDRLTDDALKKHFEDHRQLFDGSQLRLSQILWRVGGTDRAAAQTKALAKAAEIRARIVAGELSFEDAAARYSAAPSHRRGGDMGLVGRRGDLSDEFAEAAFKLQPGEVSEPLATSYGVHLIRCVEAKPGERTWREAANELRAHYGQALLKQVVADEMAKTNVTFTGATPYFVPGTQQLVVPPRRAG